MRDCAIHGVEGIMCDDQCKAFTLALIRSHVCEDNAVDSTDEPRPSGTVNVTRSCGVCRRKLSHGTDRVLWAY